MSNKLILTVESSISADGFAAKVVNDAGAVLFDGSYRYGYDASWSAGHSDSEKPYVTDIILELCRTYGIAKEDISVVAGRNIFTGKTVSDSEATYFNKYMDEINSGSRKYSEVKSMRALKRLRNEAAELTMYEIESSLIAFLKDKYGLTASISKNEGHFDIYFSNYAQASEAKPEELEAGILSFFKKLDVASNISIEKQKHGYHVNLGETEDEIQSTKLIEAVDPAKETHTCCICDKKFTGWGNDPWPVDTGIDARCCDTCNWDFVIPARLEQLSKPKVKKEAIAHGDVERSASNIVLDNKFIWLFNVIDGAGKDIEEGIEYLQDAIDILVRQDGVFLVAFPYIDPKPGDASVELVFADNPGPVVIYNHEEATAPKSQAHLEKPSNASQPKTEAAKPEGNTYLATFEKMLSETVAKNNTTKKTAIQASIWLDSGTDFMEGGTVQFLDSIDKEHFKGSDKLADVIFNNSKAFSVLSYKEITPDSNANKNYYFIKYQLVLKRATQPKTESEARVYADEPRPTWFVSVHDWSDTHGDGIVFYEEYATREAARVVAAQKRIEYPDKQYHTYVTKETK